MLNVAIGGGVRIGEVCTILHRKGKRKVKIEKLKRYTPKFRFCNLILLYFLTFSMVTFKKLVSSCWLEPHLLQNWQCSPVSSISAHPILAHLILDPEVCRSLLLSSNAIAVDLTVKNWVNWSDSPSAITLGALRRPVVGVGEGIGGLWALSARMSLLCIILWLPLPFWQLGFLIGVYGTWLP